MNTKLKTLMLTAMAALLGAGTAFADPNPGNDSAQFTVRITPNVDLGVTVDTTGANWEGASTDLDITQDLATDARLEAPVSVAMAGNFNNQELTLTGAALDTWALDTDEVDAENQLRLYALFGRTAYAASPAVSDFDGVTNLIVTSAGQAGQVQADEGGNTNHKYELSSAHAEYADVDGMPATATRKLWLRSRTPSTTSTGGQARFTVTLTAVTGAGQ